MKILVVDDERMVRKALQELLSGDGYEVRAVASGAQAVEAVRNDRPDLVLLDVMMPGMGGYETCLAIRREDAEIPVIFLTALDSEADELRGLRSGADDFIAKSASESVLLARIASALRRFHGDVMVRPDREFVFGAWTVRPLSLVMCCGTATVDLSLRELEMLRWFGSRPNEVFSTDALLTRFWGSDFDGGVSALHMQMKRLRAKLGPDGAMLVSIRGEGYALRP